MEIDPAITTRSQIDALAGLGFNRISMGVQDFDPKVQETVGRIQGEKETADLVQAARDDGFKGVNLDLIYGLPYQTRETWKRTLERILAIRPDRMAVFGFAYVPWVKPHQRLLPEAALPRTSERVALFFDAVETFTRSGYRLIGLDHFALESDEMARAQDEGVLTRNFQGYTVRPADDTIAFGMTSISDLGGAYAQNAHRLRDWAEKVEAGILPVVKGASVNEDDVLRRHVINRVMCLLRMDLREVAAAVRAAGPGRDRGLHEGRPPRAGLRRPRHLRRRRAAGHAGRAAAGPQRGHDVRRLPARARAQDKKQTFSRTV